MRRTGTQNTAQHRALRRDRSTGMRSTVVPNAAPIDAIVVRYKFDVETGSGPQA